MPLRRQGNKSRIAAEIIKHFPPHSVYIEPFFGAGGLFFNKPKARYNILNDLDDEVFNFWCVLRDNKDALREELKKPPIHSSVWNHFKANRETDPVRRAARFLYLSNLGYMGSFDTMRVGARINTKEVALDRFDSYCELITGCVFTKYDFRDFFKTIERKRDQNILCYCDPPYIGTSGKIYAPFKEQDFVDLLDILMRQNFKFAVSEFESEFVMNESMARGLNITTIAERCNLKNRRIEILITNYDKHLSLF